MDEIERRVVEAVDLDGLVGWLGELIGLRSLSGQETAAQEWVAARLGELGLAVDRWALDFEALRAHPQFSMEAARERGLGVVGVLGEDAGGPSLILNGHVDVVPAGDEGNWRYPPWRATVAEGRVYGRGSADMKGGLCCALFAAKALRDAGVRLRGRLLIESVVGEEDGGVGTLAAVLCGYRADGAVVVEPTGLAVAPAQAGALGFRVTVPGLAAHGCVREEGVSAVEKFWPIHRALLALEREQNEQARDPLYARYQLPYALSIGRVRAGNWPSSVAESLVFEGRYGVPVGVDVAAARRRFEAAVAQAAAGDDWLREHAPRVEWWGGQFEPAAIPAGHPLVETVAGACADAAGRAAAVEGMTYGADMRLLVNVGQTPTVLFGPGDVRQAHRPDEFVPIDELLAATRTLALAAMRFCGLAAG